MTENPTTEQSQETRRNCASCGEEKPVSEMSICMAPGPIHRYVCDLKCMLAFYRK